MEEKLKKYWRNSSRKAARYQVRQHGLDHVFFKVMCSFYRTARSNRKEKLMLRYDHFFILVYIKNMMVESGREHFVVHDLKKFIRENTGRTVSSQHIYRRLVVLMKFNYIMIVDKNPAKDWFVRYALTINAREFFREMNKIEI